MKEYLVKIPDAEEEVLVALMEKFGAEVEAINQDKSAQKKKGDLKKKKEEKKVSTTWLFGKWKDIDIDPVTFRKEVWREK